VEAHEMKIPRHKIGMAGLGVIRRNHVLNVADHGLSAVHHLDAYRSAWLPANLTQTQRDYFGLNMIEPVKLRSKEPYRL
jgi:6-phosphogluconate dehydrogenase